LEYPHYTRPQDFEGRTIPDVLSGGNHSEIAKYRTQMAQKLTRERRPDLWTQYQKTRKPL
jgi:tRNA (guanine37-N1)-methyltransferase